MPGTRTGSSVASKRERSEAVAVTRDPAKYWQSRHSVCDSLPRRHCQPSFPLAWVSAAAGNQATFAVSEAVVSRSRRQAVGDWPTTRLKAREKAASDS